MSTIEQIIQDLLCIPLSFAYSVLWVNMNSINECGLP